MGAGLIHADGHDNVHRRFSRLCQSALKKNGSKPCKTFGRMLFSDQKIKRNKWQYLCHLFHLRCQVPSCEYMEPDWFRTCTATLIIPLTNHPPDNPHSRLPVRVSHRGNQQYLPHFIFQHYMGYMSFNSCKTYGAWTTINIALGLNFEDKQDWVWN